MPAVRVETEYVATPLALSEDVPSCVVPLKNETIPVGVPVEEDVTVAARVTG
jgi:hypothetical protein